MDRDICLSRVTSYKPLISFLIAVVLVLVTTAMPVSAASYNQNVAFMVQYFNNRLTANNMISDEDPPFDKFYTLDNFEYIDTVPAGIYRLAYSMAILDYMDSHNGKCYAFISCQASFLSRPRIICQNTPFSFGVNASYPNAGDVSIIGSNVTIYDFRGQIDSLTFTTSSASTYYSPLYSFVRVVPNQFAVSYGGNTYYSSDIINNYIPSYDNYDGQYDIYDNINSLIGNEPTDSSSIVAIAISQLNALNTLTYWDQYIADRVGSGDYTISQYLDKLNWALDPVNTQGGIAPIIGSNNDRLYEIRDKLDMVFPEEFSELNDEIISQVTDDSDGLGLTVDKISNAKGGLDEGLSSYSVDTSDAEYSDPFSATTHQDWRFFSQTTANNLTVHDFNSRSTKSSSATYDNLDLYDQNRKSLYDLLGW